MQRQLRRLARMVGVGSALLLLAAGCSGSGSSSATSSPTAPSGTPSSSAITINIVGMSGSQSFSPNPVTVNAGQQIVFHNSDSTTHHIVQDGGAWDTGNLAPGASSSPITISTTSEEPFHCTIHPSMVGSLNGTSTQAAGNPCQGAYCG